MSIMSSLLSFVSAIRAVPSSMADAAGAEVQKQTQSNISSPATKSPCDQHGNDPHKQEVTPAVTHKGEPEIPLPDEPSIKPPPPGPAPKPPPPLPPKKLAPINKPPPLKPAPKAGPMATPNKVSGPPTSASPSRVRAADQTPLDKQIAAADRSYTKHQTRSGSESKTDGRSL
ncbi:hypothetical protein AA12717_3749 [Gluconacetobacter sacchari DSM 12717]|uniref:Uncharacterized protein n=1 Tax=Gluconacetobacter sacchari DSM 12717 TaxID=1307940 RepID=A0ABQ0PCF2_9PROT|nr:hypothetical protein AA12717_3749 [Gluconacetobacter sacchari DSM 12717]